MSTTAKSKVTTEQIAALMAAREYGINTILFRNSLAKKLDLSMTESLCMTLLGTKLAKTPTELAHYTGLTTGSITTMLDRLEVKKFIKRSPNPDDRRGTIINFTKKYEHESAELVKDIQQANLKVVANYSDNELTAIANFMQDLAKELDILTDH